MCETNVVWNRLGRTNPFLTPAGVSLGCVLLISVTMGGFECEMEPNGGLVTSNFIRPDEFGSGSIVPVGDHDFYRAESRAVGDLVFAYVDTNASTTSSDSFLTVRATDGSVMETDDDDGPPISGLGSVVAGAIVPQAGSVFYEVNQLGDVATIEVPSNPGYSLYQAIVAPGNTAAETEANDTSATANIISAAMMTGTISVGGSADFFKFTAPAGSKIVVIMDDDPDNDTLLTDTKLDIIGIDGMTVLAAGDQNDADDANAAGSVPAPVTGTYFVRVDDDGGTADSEYRFVLLINGVVYVDSDADGVPSSDDNCPANANPAQLDTDGDGVGDLCDACPAGIFKTATAGVCGCAMPDVDINADGVIDCALSDPARSLLARVGLLLVPDARNQRVMAFDPADGDLADPNFIPSDAVHLSSPTAAILGPDRNSILVSDSTNDLVQRYDLDGNFLGTFAPAGGVNLAIMDTPAGLAIRPNGNVVVCITSGANSNAVAEFDAAGNCVGNFIAPGAGGLVSPQDIHFLPDGRALVSDGGSGAIRRYDALGASLGDFATIRGLTAQILEATDGNVLAAVVFGDQQGIVEFSSGGAFVSKHAPNELALFQGVAELGNGNLLVSTTLRTTTGNLPGGVFEMTRAGALVETHIAGYDMRLIEYALIDADGDGVGDLLDGCPNDPTKIAPGQCGCGNADSDADGDGTADCNDACPADALKTEPGVCGCGVAETDADGNGTADCLDAPPAPPPAAGCCAPGVFPTVGLFMPMVLAGWRLRRRVRARVGELR